MTATTPQAALALRNVLCATDFSPCSERALLHAVAVAHHYGSTLHLAHVVQPTVFSLVPPEGYMGTVEAEGVVMDRARGDAQNLVADVLRRTHCEGLDSHIWVNLGLVGRTLCAIIRREHIDLAVVGTHGRTGIRKVVLGSVAEDVFRHASCPVLTVGPHSWQSDPQSVHLKHVLFPTDLSEDSARALSLAMAIAAKFDATVTVMHVVEVLDSEAAHDKRRVVSALEERMLQMVSSAGPRPLGIAARVEFGDVADTVIETAALLGVDLIAFGLKAPDTYVDRLPWMHAYEIVYHATCPVLSLRGASSRE
ncbi:MAG: universal stress protein [Terriglobales bacterium]